MQDATTGESLANDEVDAGEVRGYPEAQDAIDALRKGRVDAVIIDQPVAADAEENLDVEFAETISTGEFYGFPVSHDNSELLDAVNRALSRIKADGTLDSLYEEYFGIPAPDTVLDGG